MKKIFLFLIFSKMLEKIEINETARLKYITRELGTTDFPYPLTKNGFVIKIRTYLELVLNTFIKEEKVAIVNEVTALNIILVKAIISEDLRSALCPTIVVESFFNYIKSVYEKCEEFILNNDPINRNLELYYLIIDNNGKFGNNDFVGEYDRRKRKRKERDDMNDLCVKMAKI